MNLLDTYRIVEPGSLGRAEPSMLAYTRLDKGGRIGANNLDLLVSQLGR